MPAQPVKAIVSGREVTCYVSMDGAIWGMAHELYNHVQIQTFIARGKPIPTGQITLVSQPHTADWFAKHSRPSPENNRLIRLLRNHPSRTFNPKPAKDRG